MRLIHNHFAYNNIYIILILALIHLIPKLLLTQKKGDRIPVISNHKNIYNNLLIILIAVNFNSNLPWLSTQEA